MSDRAKARDEASSAKEGWYRFLAAAFGGVCLVVLIGNITGNNPLDVWAPPLTTEAPLERLMSTLPERHPVVPFPENGSILVYKYSDAVRSPFTIDATRISPDSNVLVRAFDWTTGESLFDSYVKGGHTASVEIPLGKYKFSSAQGNTWYGPEVLFGRDTPIVEALRPLEFTQSESGAITGHTLYLDQRIGGNFPTTTTRGRGGFDVPKTQAPL